MKDRIETGEDVNTFSSSVNPGVVRKMGELELEEARRQVAIGKYGRDLGEAFYDYAYSESNYPAEIEKRYSALAASIVVILNDERQLAHKKASAIESIFEAVETRMANKIAQIERRSTEAFARTAPIG